MRWRSSARMSVRRLYRATHREFWHRRFDRSENMGFAGATIDSYDPGTGLLQLKNGPTLATLRSANASLGAGSFHIDDDDSGDVLVSHHG